MPLVWATLSRSLLTYIQNKSYGKVTVFVDDFIGFSSSAHAESDHNIISNAITTCFNNPDADAATKRIPPCICTDVIGWSINLEYEMLSPSTKAIDKLLFHFTFNDSCKAYTLNQYQQFASRAQRYSEGIMGMKPFVTPFNKMISSFSIHDNNIYRTKHLSSEAKLCFIIWQYVSLLCYQNPILMAVPLLLFRHNRIPEWVIQTDASPFGIGAAIFS
jgi:hypothetical protein